jgi:hypothetical protein
MRFRVVAEAPKLDHEVFSIWNSPLLSGVSNDETRQSQFGNSSRSSFDMEELPTAWNKAWAISCIDVKESHHARRNTENPRQCLSALDVGFH